MRNFLSILIVLLVTAANVELARAQSTLYWDVNGTAPGATNPDTGTADGVWDLDTANWNQVADGTGTPVAWTANSNAVFSAGTDVTNDPDVSGAFIGITGTMQAASVLIEEGYVALQTGILDHGTGTITVNANSTFEINSTSRLNLTGGKIVLNGGTLFESNPGNAGSFVGSSTGMKGIEVNGIGFIGYDDFDGVPDNKVSIFSGVITGTGGAVDNGGAGTLVKIGPDQIGIGASNQNGQHSQELFTFAKLEVREGAYRLRAQTFDTTVRETAFGAVPLAVLPDAITLNGGGIGTNTTVTLHENRGITIGPNGGYLDHAATAGLNIPGPVTAAPGATLTIGSPTATATNNVTFALSSPDNVDTFQGNIHARRGVLRLDSSLNAANFSGTGMDATNVATVSVTVGQTFTFGSGNQDTTFDGIVAGAGTWRKIGTGKTTFTGATNTHTGDTRVEGGTLSISNPYLADAGDVFLSTGAILDLNFTGTDTIDQLFIDGLAQQIGLWGAVGNAGAVFTTPLLTGTGLLQISTGPPVGGVTGDYNDNGVVDAADYVVWRDLLGTNTQLENEGSGVTPGMVTQEDYDEWRTNFGRTPGAGAAAAAGVPEPSASALAIVAALVAAGVRRRRMLRP